MNHTATIFYVQDMTTVNCVLMHRLAVARMAMANCPSSRGWEYIIKQYLSTSDPDNDNEVGNGNVDMAMLNL